MRKRISLARGLRLSAASILVSYLTVSLAAGIILMESALHVPRRPLSRTADCAAALTRLSKDGVVEVTATAADGAILKGWYIRPTQSNGSSVILLHGVADNREGMTQFALMFLRAGYVVLLPDSRAHGESGGMLTTYGLLESEDVQHWSQWLAAQRYESGDRFGNGCTYLFGESMGAAIAVEALERVPSVCAVVAEASFSSFREIGNERIAQGL